MRKRGDDSRERWVGRERGERRRVTIEKWLVEGVCAYKEREGEEGVEGMKKK